MKESLGDLLKNKKKAQRGKMVVVPRGVCHLRLDIKPQLCPKSFTHSLLPGERLVGLHSELTSKVKSDATRPFSLRR